jgi:hypothetical protein
MTAVADCRRTETKSAGLALKYNGAQGLCIRRYPAFPALRFSTWETLNLTSLQRIEPAMFASPALRGTIGIFGNSTHKSSRLQNRKLEIMARGILSMGH